MKLDETVEVTEDDGDGQKDEVGWLTCEETDQLDDLGDKHETALSDHGIHSILRCPGLGSFVGQEDNPRVKSEGQ